MMIRASFLFALTLTCMVASLQAVAQVNEYQYQPGSYEQPVQGREDMLQDMAQNQAKEATDAAMADARQTAQVATNTADISEIERMTGTQDFILKLVAIVMPLLIAMMTGFMLYIQIKQKTVSEVRQVQQREDLILVARSVNGMKTELVATKELTAFMEALNLIEDNKISDNAKLRLAELQDAVKYATERANNLAHEAVTKLDKIQGQQPALASNTVNLAQGEQQVMEGVQFGEEPLNHDAIGVSNGQVKNVVGT